MALLLPDRPAFARQGGHPSGDRKNRPSWPKSPETASIDAAIAWNRIASSYESSLKFRWLTRAVFAHRDQDKVLVQIPLSFAGELRSVVGEAGRRDAETRLRKALGREVILRLEVGENLAEALPADSETPTDSPPTGISDVCRTPGNPKDPAEEFRNDPLIKKALEIFAGEIQTATK